MQDKYQQPTAHQDPRVVINPHPTDPRLVVVSFDGVEYILARAFARRVADEIASVCPKGVTS